MADFWQRLFDTSDFPPRWNCGDWTAGHGWLHIASDLGVWSAYLAIPCVLAYFAARRPDLPFRRVFWLFGAFILACGTTHLMEAVIFWWPAYRLAAVIKLLTACISWATVLALIPITPKALALRSPQDFELEIDARQRAEAALRAMQGELEQRVVRRTEELSRANVELQAEMAVRQHVERVLEGEREWFEVTIDSIGDAVIATDTKGQVMFLNRVARELTGFTDEVDEQPLATIFQVIRDGDGEPVPDPVSMVLRTGRSSEPAHRILLVTRAGDRRPIEHSAAPIRSREGEMLGVVLVFRDISERRSAEESLLQADRHKDEFLAMLGHELRNPLAGIAGAIHVLEAIGAPSSEADEMRTIIARQTAHMARLIDDLLEVSRISRGKLQLRLERIDLGKLIRTTVDDFRLAASAPDRAVKLNVPEESVWVMGDPTRLAQVMINLLQNADKFSPAEAPIKVELRRDADRAMIRVADHGIGMDAATLARAFEAFRQADQSIDRSRGGLGLGLALVKGLVELHGGRVSASSGGVGQGAEFTISLPLTEPAAGAIPPAPAVREAAASRRVLIIDDRRDAALPMQTLLRRLGHTVEVAQDGPEGLRLAIATRPQVVLCDIGLPGGMDGYAVAAALRGDEATRSAYLVAVTGYGQEEDRRKALAAGFDRHLTKPVGLATLREVLAAQAGEPVSG